MVDFLNQAQPVENLPIQIEPITPLELQTAKLTPRVILPNLLYADVRTRFAAGGIGKTTLAIYEATRLALGFELWGQKPSEARRTVFVTREDSREILVARLREIIRAENLNQTQTDQVLANVRIIDLTGDAFRLSIIAGDMVMPDSAGIDALCAALEGFNPDWVIFDPLVSFGVGESRVNDAEQGLIEAFRIIRNRLNCCVEGIHHTGKAASREKINDQYAGRGGSALPDGARMVAVLNPLNPREWAQATGGTLCPDESALVMALPKLSYCKPQKELYIKRHGYSFEMIVVNKRTPAQEAAAITEQIYQFIFDQYQQGRRYSKADLDAQTKLLNLSRNEIRAATTELMVSGRVLYHEIKGKSGSHYEPLETARLGETSNEVAEID